MTLIYSQYRPLPGHLYLFLRGLDNGPVPTGLGGAGAKFSTTSEITPIPKKVTATRFQALLRHAHKPRQRKETNLQGSGPVPLIQCCGALFGVLCAIPMGHPPTLCRKGLPLPPYTR